MISRKFIYLGKIVFVVLFTGCCFAEEIPYNPLLGPDTKSMLTQAAIAERNGDIGGAIEIYKKILETQPRNVCSLNSVAGLYGKLGRYEEEIRWSKKAIDIDVDYGLAYINYGDAMANLGNLDEAKYAYERAAELNPKSAVAVYNLGILAERKKDYLTASQFYQKAIEINPNFEDAYYNLGIVYLHLQKRVEAVAAFRKVLGLNPKALDAKKMLEELGLKS
jgi:superkiller protein 3